MVQDHHFIELWCSGVLGGFRDGMEVEVLILRELREQCSYPISFPPQPLQIYSYGSAVGLGKLLIQLSH